MMNPIQALEGSGKLLSFDDVRQRVAELADLNYADRRVDMTQTHVTEQLDFYIPGMGILEMTDWSKSQIGSALGVRWDKWFDPELVDHKSVQDELQRRFRAGEFQFLVRGRRHEEPRARSQGLLRGFLGPRYHPVDDRRILDVMYQSEMGDYVDDIHFVRWDKRDWLTDKSTHITGMFRDPLTIEQPDSPPETYYHGFHIRNSEVGFAAVTIDDFWFNLLCANGLIVMDERRNLYRRRHIGVDDDVLEDELNKVWPLIAERKDKTQRALEESVAVSVERPLETMRSFLRRHNIPKYLINSATDAYEADPRPTRYGITQAITAAARQLDDPDKRLDMERVGGRFLLAA